MPDAAVVQRVAAYVPSCLVEEILSGHAPHPGRTTPLEAAVLFADISGFTPMAEALARAGRRGAEEMTQHLNATFSATIPQITAYGGDVAAFGGDAILAFFAPQADEPPRAVAWRALTCAMEMRRSMEPFGHVETAVGPFVLRMKFGLSFGPIIVVSVGSPERGLEFVIAGTPVDQAASNENYAQSSQVVADENLLTLVGDRATVEPLVPGVSHVLTAKPAPELPRPPIDYTGLTEEQRRAILDGVAAYLPPKLYEDLISKGDFVGDHRPVTSLFVNFTGMDYDHDPDVGTRLQSYITHTQALIQRYDGNLNRVLTGDKGSQLHILFGAPVAHEDDKIRALRCALALQRDLETHPFIQAQRIGLASGYVFAGPVGAMTRDQAVAAGNGPAVTRGEYTVMGDIVNLSARLTGVCPSGETLADDYTRSRTAQRFEFRPFGSVKLKGKAEPVAPYLLQRERPVDNALVTRYLLSQRPLVGRHREMSVIDQVVTDAMEGKGQVLAITGPAGVGKSRLIEEAVRRWLGAEGIGYGGDCVSHGAEIPYVPWADLWRAQFDLQENDTPQQRQEKILSFGNSLGLDLSEWAALVAGLLGLRPETFEGPRPEAPPEGPRPETSEGLRPETSEGPEVLIPEEHPALAALDPEARHLRLLDLTAELIASQARQAPTLILLEDLHWADRASLELIDYVAERITDLPVLMCLAFRPRDELSLTCLDQTHCRILALTELSDEDGTALIRSMLGDVELPPGFLHAVNAKAQGNPLFVEELVNGLVDAGLLQRENGTYRAVGALDQIEIPDTVQAVLMARIDRLTAPARDVLRVASVVGRQFAYTLLRGIYPFAMSDAEMLDRLTALERLDLTRLERPEPELEYLFKHTMTREVAYESLSFALRRDLHRRIGQFLEQQHSDHLETLYGTLAHRFAQGGQPARALFYALAAGSQAEELFANDEALAYYRQAEKLLEQLPPLEHQQEAFRLYASRGELHTLLGNFDQAESDLEQALALARAEGNLRAEAQALNGLAYLRYWQAHNEEMLRLAQRALRLAEAEGHQRETMMAQHRTAMALVELGKRDEAVQFFLKAREVAEALNDRQALSTIHMGIAVTTFNQGRFQNALEALENLLHIYRESGEKNRISACLSNIANTRYYLGDLEAAQSAFRESIAVAKEIGRRAGQAYSLCDLGGLHCHQGQYSAGLEALQEAATIFKEIDDDSGCAYCNLTLASEYYLDVGHEDRAETLLRKALPVLRGRESNKEVAEALLALAQLHLRRGKIESAQTNLNQAATLCQAYDLRWRWPKVYLLRAKLALSQEDANSAIEWAQQALDAIKRGGCPDIAPAAHIILAQTSDDPLYHYQLAVDAARQRSRHIDLARTLTQVGDYLSNCDDSRLRARGEAYRKEAQALLKEMPRDPGATF